MTARTATTATPLLRRLRAQFIALNMTLAAIVLVAAFATICYLDYRNSVDEIYRSLSQTANSTARAPVLTIIPGYAPLPSPFDETNREKEGGDSGNSSNADNADGADEAFERPQIGESARGQHESHLPIAVYLYENGAATLVASQSSATVPSGMAPTALAFALSSADTQGYSPDMGLFFVRQDRAYGSVIAFADDSTTHGWQSLAWGLAVVGLLALGVLFLINLRFSRWVLRPVETAWAQQQQFVANASHELKTPLTVILANSAILRSRPHDTIAEQAQWIESTQSEAERMQTLVTDMLDLARPTPEAHTAEQQPAVNLSRLVTGEVLQFESVAFERGLALESEIAEGLSVRGSERRLERLTSALLDNACKYANEGGTIAVHLRRADANAELAVTNTGDPIAPEDLPHLFDRFYRADKARTHNAAPSTRAAEDEGATQARPRPNGYGLGLAIAQEIARNHGGTITAASTAEHGTTFTVRLPLA